MGLVRRVGPDVYTLHAVDGLWRVGHSEVDISQDR